MVQIANVSQQKLAVNVLLPTSSQSAENEPFLDSFF
jgi:hypothetical protein